MALAVDPLLARARLMALALLLGCSGAPGGADVDTDADSIPDQTEDRNGNGRVDPGETDPGSSDTDGDGIPDDEEVSTQACSPGADRPFAVHDVPGADAEVLVDGGVSAHALLFANDGRNPGAVFYDPGLDVAAAVLGKRAVDPDPAVHRDHELGRTFSAFGRVSSPRVRTFVTVQGFAAEQARFTVDLASPSSAAAFVNAVTSEAFSGIEMQGTLPDRGAPGPRMSVALLTVSRGAGRVVMMVAAAAVDEPSDGQRIRLEELTDGTNVARRGSFTRHVCDPFVAEAQAKADILWVVDDSGSMEDDQMAVRAASSAMAEVLEAAQVDFRLAVARMYADENPRDPRRGRLAGDGFTTDIARFQRDVLVGADGGWEPGLEVGLAALRRASPPTAPDEAPDPQRLRSDAARIVIHLSDERDQTVECAACGGCERAEGEPRSCTRPEGQAVIDEMVAEYLALDAVSFALVGDLPSGCSQGGSRDDFEPGQGYVEVAAATGGQFGSLCGDMQQNLQDVARVATGVSSVYTLSAQPASATLKVAIGPPGQGRVVPRSTTDGFDYDAVQNTIVFYGAARPEEGDEVVVAYRRWDWANNPGTPADPCDLCEDGAWCDPELDRELCQTPCGDVTCEGGLACLPDTARCGDPEDVPPAQTPCGECDPGLVCDPGAEQCVPPCEDTGCDGDQLCNRSTHLCEDFDV